jgi:hypothetical protein
MQIATSTAVQAATAAAQGETADAVNIAVLKKAIDIQANSALTLLQALPSPVALATSGTVGTQVNTFA